MRLMSVFVSLAVTVVLAGCGEQPVPPASTQDPGAPLTLGEWKSLPADKKYDGMSLERLKDTEPKFQDSREWDRFMRTVVNPGKKRELAAAKS
ncbi:hypothetical protein [Gemmata sp.]|uniref:hypothetical protein n=1 Tax=Gemmata sp. TaxID=1914242 RepID=UPI003F6F68CE